MRPPAWGSLPTGVTAHPWPPRLLGVASWTGLRQLWPGHGSRLRVWPAGPPLLPSGGHGAAAGLWHVSGVCTRLAWVLLPLCCCLGTVSGPAHRRSDSV